MHDELPVVSIGVKDAGWTSTASPHLPARHHLGEASARASDLDLGIDAEHDGRLRSLHTTRGRGRIGMRSAPRRSTVSGVSSLPSRPLPYVGMPVLIVYLAAAEPDIINEVADGGRTLTVDRTGLTLRRTIGRLIRAGEPS
jgi:hypothetical protein